jgi:hypothetical protein
VNSDWEWLGGSVFRCRLPFRDIGLVEGSTGTLLIDTGWPKRGPFSAASSTASLISYSDTTILITSSAFDNAAISCAPEVATTMFERTERLRAYAILR